MVYRTTLRADLRERHISMMTISSIIGFGLFLRSGIVIYNAGPGLALIALVGACSVVWAVVGCMGEMTALYPLQGSLFEFPGRFLDEGVGYATAWISWLGLTIRVSAQLTAVAQLWKFHFDEQYLHDVGYPASTLQWNTLNYSPAVWAFSTLILIGVMNCLPVRYYGELQYGFGVLKITFVTGLILLNIILSASQPVPVPDNNHFWTWSKPWGFSTNRFNLRMGADKLPITQVTGAPGNFLALWTGLTTLMYSLGGFEILTLTAPENKDLQKSEAIKISTKKLCLRVFILYFLATFAGGLNVPYNDKYLEQAAWTSVYGGQNSIFVLAAVRNHLKGWPNFLNAVFVFSAATAGSNFLYTASRILHAIASIPEAWPLFAKGLRERLQRTTSQGVPLNAVLLSWCFGFLSLLCITPESSQVLGWLSTNITISVMIIYAIVCVSYLHFFRSIKRAANDTTLENHAAFSRDDEQYPYRTAGQRFRAMYGLSFCVLIIFFNGWRSFVSPFKVVDFVVAYISIPFFVLVVAAYHVASDGWKPWEWRFHASGELQRPPPVVVASGVRKGVLVLPDPKRAITEDNVREVLRWVWGWVRL